MEPQEVGSFEGKYTDPEAEPLSTSAQLAVLIGENDSEVFNRSLQTHDSYNCNELLG